MNPYPWQSNQAQLLFSQFDTDVLPHALLFTGADGIGKIEFAHAMVARMFCKNPDNHFACHQCEACHQLAIGTHPDVKIIRPPEGKQSILVDQIRDVIHYVSLTPHSAPQKVVVIERAELMNNNAANSLLKTLEEPPASSMLILTTHRSDVLLPTVRSRCQVMQFPIPDHQSAMNWLSGKLTTEQTKNAEEILSLAGGAPLKALKFAQDDIIEKRDDYFSALEKLKLGNENPIAMAKSWLKHDLNTLIYCMVTCVNDIIRLKVSDQPPLLNHPSLQSRSRKIAAQTQLSHLLDFYQKLIKAHELKLSNINSQSVLEDLLISWVNLKRND